MKHGMKHLYIDSRLHSIALASRKGKRPNVWIFSQGRPWLLLTPRRLKRLASLLGLKDGRVESLVVQVQRHCAVPSRYCRPLGVTAVDPSPDGLHPIAVCPECDRVHRPHPLDSRLACDDCRENAELLRNCGPTPLAEEEYKKNEEIRRLIQENNPGEFVDGELSPNWRLNHHRRLRRDWEAAIGRILLGMTYRRVARDFNCSLGLLHKKVHEKGYWENN